jgi:hypothetical protein
MTMARVITRARKFIGRYALILLALDVGSDVAFYAYIWWRMQ